MARTVIFKPMPCKVEIWWFEYCKKNTESTVCKWESFAPQKSFPSLITVITKGSYQNTPRLNIKRGVKYLRRMENSRPLN